MQATDEGPGTDGDTGGLGEPYAAGLFAIVWETLVEVLGTAAVAAIVRRATRRAAVESAELVDLVVLRENLTYRYKLPPSWWQKTERAPPSFRVLVAEIGRLLRELTGTVLIARLEQVPALRAWGLVWRTKEAT